jgi:hypothetical protein
LTEREEAGQVSEETNGQNGQVSLKLALTNCRTRQRQQRGRRLARIVKRQMDKMDR